MLQSVAVKRSVRPQTSAYVTSAITVGAEKTIIVAEATVPTAADTRTIPANMCIHPHLLYHFRLRVPHGKIVAVLG